MCTGLAPLVVAILAFLIQVLPIQAVPAFRIRSRGLNLADLHQVSSLPSLEVLKREKSREID